MRSGAMVIAAVVFLIACSRRATPAHSVADAGLATDVSDARADARPGLPEKPTPASPKNLGHGRSAGGLGGRRARAPDVIPGPQINAGVGKNSIAQGHRNEVKLCYEKELARNPTLAGRIEVQFTISAQGKVIAAVLVKSTMNHPVVESCVVAAVRRWEFPRPIGGGIVIVSYPFNFSSEASAGR